GMEAGGRAAGGGKVCVGGSDGVHGQQLWSSDGTASGTAMLTAVNAAGGGLSPTGLTAVGTALYFAGDDGSHGQQLWASDGTAGGTAMVAALNGTSGSAAGNLTNVAGTLYFTAYTAGGFPGWQSDGTAPGAGA